MRTLSTAARARRLGGLALVVLLTGCSSAGSARRPSPATDPPSVPTTIVPGATAPAAGGGAPPASPEPDPGDAGLEVGVAWPDAPAYGLGDPNFPDLGAPGLDTLHYDVTLRYDRQDNALSGTLDLRFQVTEERTEISLDAGEELSTGPVELDGSPVDSEHRGAELIIRPTSPLPGGSTHHLALTWTVEPQSFESLVGFEIGWFPTELGSYALDEPDGLHHWMPANDHPTDKATWQITIDVPAGVGGVANGALTAHQQLDGRERWTWTIDDPISTYLVLVATGDYELVDGVSPAGVPLSHAVLRRAAGDAQVTRALGGTGEMVDYLASVFGPYPFASYGLVIADSDPQLAMETQTRSLFSMHGVLDDGVLVHELAHQWFGDSVTLGSWTDTWLNEGFATYAEWLWNEERGGPSTRQQAEAFLGTPWGSPPGQPPVGAMFASSVYYGGAVTLEALRAEVGDQQFFDILRRWAASRRHSTGTTAAFEALASEVAGRDLGTLFDTWLWSTSAPSELPG